MDLESKTIGWGQLLWPAIALVIWKVAMAALTFGHCPPLEHPLGPKCLARRHDLEAAGRYGVYVILAWYAVAVMFTIWRLTRRERPERG